MAAGRGRPSPRVNGRTSEAVRACRPSFTSRRIVLAVLLHDLGSTPGGQAVRCRRGKSRLAAHQLTTLRRGGELRPFRKLRVLNFATPQVQPRSGLLTGRELAAPRSSLSELGHLTSNRRLHRHRRRHKTQDALVSGGNGGPGGGVLARRCRV